MTRRFICPPLSGPMLVFTVKFNKTISWTENLSSICPNVKAIVQKMPHFSATLHEITQIIPNFLNLTDVTK